MFHFKTSHIIPIRIMAGRLKDTISHWARLIICKLNYMTLAADIHPHIEINKG